MTGHELYDGLKRIAEAQEATMRQCRIMVAGFKATGEQDIRYMDGFMDGLLDFMDQGSDTEQLYRDYLAYISSFNPEEGKRRFLDLEDSLGYWTPAVIAAGIVAREVHHGQKDKGGNDYFEHLLSEIREIRMGERRFYQKLTDIYATSIDYNRDAPTTTESYKTVCLSRILISSTKEMDFFL